MERPRDITLYKKMIEDCAERGTNTAKNKNELFWAVKFVDRHANQLFYQDLTCRKKLLDRCNGSWELRLACNSDKDCEFYPHPEFRSFAMAFTTVSDTYFGKGISTNDKDYCFVALAGPSTRNYWRQQVFMNYEDFFINVSPPSLHASSYTCDSLDHCTSFPPKNLPRHKILTVFCSKSCVVLFGTTNKQQQQ